MSESNNSSNLADKLGFSGVLTIAFIVLKLTGHIAWSWWWVLSPVWIPLAFVLVLVGALAVLTYLRTRK